MKFFPKRKMTHTYNTLVLRVRDLYYTIELVVLLHVHALILLMVLCLLSNEIENLTLYECVCVFSLQCVHRHIYAGVLEWA